MGRQDDEKLRFVASLLLEAARLQLAALEILNQRTPLTDVGLASPGSKGSDLTLREQEVLDALARGLSNQEISRDLGISEHTVRTHLQAIFRKLGATQRTEAIVRAVHAGLLTFDSSRDGFGTG